MKLFKWNVNSKKGLKMVFFDLRMGYFKFRELNKEFLDKEEKN